MDDRKIGFFDSGVGGLTSIPYIMRDLPDEHVIFFGDTARTPYGSKAEHVIRRFALEIADFMVKRDVKMLVSACNTLSAIGLDAIREAHPGLPVIGVIEPICDVIAKELGTDENLGIIATRATVKSGAYVDLIREKAPGIRNVSQMACPAFVPLIEEGMIDNNIIRDTVKFYLDDYIRENRIDTLVLGCTHYHLIRPVIEELYPGIRTLSSSEEVAYEVARILGERDLLAGKNGEENVFYASDLSDNFMNMINMILKGSGEELNIRFKNLDM